MVKKKNLSGTQIVVDKSVEFQGYVTTDLYKLALYKSTPWGFDKGKIGNATPCSVEFRRMSALDTLPDPQSPNVGKTEKSELAVSRRKSSSQILLHDGIVVLPPVKNAVDYHPVGCYGKSDSGPFGIADNS